jgi:fatty-acyl-CoA synthase
MTGSVLAHRLPDRGIDLITGTIGDKLRANATRWPNRPALIWPEGSGVGRMSYAELLGRAEHLARWILDHADPGGRIAIWAINSVDYALLLYASALAGTILAPFNAGWTDAEARHAHDLVEPSLFLAGIDGRGEKLIDRASDIARCPVLEIAAAAVASPADAARPLPIFDSSHPYLIQFTSGTTGRAKGALLSHRAALLGGWLTLQCDDASERDVWLTPAPFHHIGGSCSISLGALSVGGAFVVVERFNAAQIVSLMKPSGATRMGGVPTMWYDILRQPDLPLDVDLRVVTLGGANVPAALIREIEERTGAVVTNVYGQSECPVICSTLPSDDVETKTQAVGLPVPHVEVKIVDTASGATLERGQAGELCVRAPIMMDGYWASPEATSRAIDSEGFMRTGDLASMNELGVCRIHGRASEMIIRGGENIYPIEVEDALLLHPAVAMAAVIGVPHPRLGQEVAAVVKLLPGAAADRSGLAQHAAGLVSYFKVPTHWRFVDVMPMTASGKIRKIDLASLFDPPSSE